MYFPYFRGRQYELIALRELVQRKLIGNLIIPVVEPVKNSSTLKSALNTFKDNDAPISLIVNPTVGDIAGEDITPVLQHITENVIPSVLINDSAEDAIKKITAMGITEDKILAILNSYDYVDYYKELFTYNAPRFTLFPDERKIRHTVNSNKVLFEDKFNKQSKNADYLKNEDEFFSEDHIYYQEEGYTGFGDYSVIGNNYEEGGFAPKAVAIHIVYFDDDNVFRIHHFVSNSNQGTEDVAGKFYEAVSKLITWYNNGHQNQDTYALSKFREYVENGYFPGLPTIKKLSIMHHLELVSKFLEGDIE